jgi:hypothetical protein
MKSTWVSVLLGVLNVMLLISIGRLVQVVGKLQDSRTADALERVDSNLSALAGERVRLADKIARLQHAIDGLRAADGSSAHGGATPEGPPFPQDPKIENLVQSYGPWERPRPIEIPRLQPEEVKHLVRERAQLPRELNDGVLLQGDLDLVLGDALWNPVRREMDGATRRELARLLMDYKYFTRLSPMERFRKYIEPEIPRLRDAGAYLEYAATEGPPLLEGVYVSHAEPSDKPGVKRIYYFHPQDYPELAHHERVEVERGLETFLHIYDLINSSPEASR